MIFFLTSDSSSDAVDGAVALPGNSSTAAEVETVAHVAAPLVN